MRAAILLIVILAGTLPGCSFERGPAHNGTNVLLIVLDTVRSDRFGSYGNKNGVTPEIDAIAERGLVFSHCYSNSSWTLPSHASMFTGLYPVGHRATQETLKLAPGHPTLAEIFTRAGYQTFGASTNPVVSINRGLGRGFEDFRELFRDEHKINHEGDVHINNLAFQRFLAERDGERPFFAFFNYIEAHWPYSAPEAYRHRFTEDRFGVFAANKASRLVIDGHYMDKPYTDETFEILKALYDGEVSYLDFQVGELVRELTTYGLDDNTIVVVTSDHGEHFGENGHLGHRFSVYNTLLSVPLIVVLPDGDYRGERREDVVQLLDLFPSLIDRCGVRYKGRVDGRNLFAEGGEHAVPAYAEYYYPRLSFSLMKTRLTTAQARGDNPIEKFRAYMRRMRTVQDGNMKLIWGSDGRHELYDLAADPGELTNLLAAEPGHPLLAQWEDLLSDYVERYVGNKPLDPTPPPGWMMPGFEEEVDDPELVKKLRSLGYIR
jgi:arylsulfatase A-like enzyme